MADGRPHRHGPTTLRVSAKELGSQAFPCRFRQLRCATSTSFSQSSFIRPRRKTDDVHRPHHTYAYLNPRQTSGRRACMGNFASSSICREAYARRDMANLARRPDQHSVDRMETKTWIANETRHRARQRRSLWKSRTGARAQSHQMYTAANRFHNGCWVRDVLGRRSVMRAWIFVFRREHNMKSDTIVPPRRRR